METSKLKKGLCLAYCVSIFSDEFNIFDDQCNFKGEGQRELKKFIKNVRLTYIVKLLNFDICLNPS